MQTFKILVIKPSSLGDIIQTLQVVEGACRAAQKQGITLHIHWIVREIFADIVRLNPFVEKCFIFERKGGIAGFYHLIQSIRKETYDWIFDFQGLLRSGLMTFFARGNHKIGRKDARECSQIFYSKTYAPKVKNPHAVDVLQALLQVLPFDFIPQRPLTFKKEAKSFIIPNNAILLFPNSRGPKKEWPYFFELTELLLEKTSFSCIWVGQQKLDKIPQHDRFINLIGKTRLSNLPMLMQHAACVIANDSGPIHLAAALNKPLVGLYGPTDANRYGPYPVEKHCVLQSPTPNITDLPLENVLKATMECLSINYF